MYKKRRRGAQNGVIIFFTSEESFGALYIFEKCSYRPTLTYIVLEEIITIEKKHLINKY